MSLGNIIEGLWISFQEGRYSDITIVCGHRVYKAHKVVICSQSIVFERMLANICQESEQNYIDLKDDRAAIIDGMMQFLYTHEYDYPQVDENETSDIPSSIEFHAMMYTIADKYDIAGLKPLSKSKYKATLEISLEPGQLLSLIKYIYANTPASDRGLRDITLHCAKLQAAKFKEASLSMQLYNICFTIPDFACDFVLDLIKAPLLLGSCSLCGPCQRVEALQLRCMKCNKGGANEDAAYKWDKRARWG